MRTGITREITQVNQPNGEIKSIIWSLKDVHPSKGPNEKTRAGQSVSGVVLGCLPQKLLQCFLNRQIPGTCPRTSEQNLWEQGWVLQFAPVLPVSFMQTEAWEPLSPHNETWRRNETRREVLTESGRGKWLDPWHHTTGSVSRTPCV